MSKMKRVALILNGRVENVALWDGESVWSWGSYIAVDVTDLPIVSPGWLYDGIIFSEPADE